ncbi:C-type lectin [Aphelenchoides avenae]|nr:C-type lectin [Aphelenchus avenae]
MTTPLNVAVFLALAAVTFGQLIPPPKCAAGAGDYQNRCYKVYRSSADCDRDFNYWEAQAFCQANGGELASIHSEPQNEYIKDLIKRGQKTCGCRKDFLYWIGLQLQHGPDARLTDAAWSDGTPVNYGNPLSTDFQPPFLEGRPAGSDPNDDLSEVCPAGSEKACVQILGFGRHFGQWTDANCSKVHEQPNRCSSNSTCVAPHKKHHRGDKSSSSSEEDEDADSLKTQCRADRASQGFVCQYCPYGSVPFQDHCYLPVPLAGSSDQYEATCKALGGGVVSIHSDAENQFVWQLAAAAGLKGWFYTGLRLVHSGPQIGASVVSAAWTDGTPVDFGNPMTLARGTYPWCDQYVRPQPDNVPVPGNIAIAWLPGAPAPITNFGTWDDTTDVPTSPPSGTVCKF